MMQKNNIWWGAALVGNVLFCCVLSLIQTSAATPPAREPFANAEEQRHEIITQLKEIVAEMKAQTALLRSGEVKVIVTAAKKR